MGSKIQKFRKSLGPRHERFTVDAYRDLGYEMYAYINVGWGYIGTLPDGGSCQDLWEYYTHGGTDAEEIWRCTDKLSQKQYLNLVKWSKIIREFYEVS